MKVLNKSCFSLCPVGGVPLELQAAKRLRLTREGLAPVEVTITSPVGYGRDHQLYFKKQQRLCGAILGGSTAATPVEVEVEVID
jgi:hypothetical protein